MGNSEVSQGALWSLKRRDRAEGEERPEAILSAYNGQQVPLRGADHPDGGLLGWGPCRETRLWPHQDLHGQTQQVSRTFLFITYAGGAFN